MFAGLFVPVWWCWRSFTWYATGFDSDDPRCRIGLLAGMLGVAVLSIGVAGAAGDGESRTFVLAYVGLLIILGGLYGRIWLLFPAARSLARRYVLGYAVSVVIWSASLALQEGARPWLWAVAMVVLIATPVAVLRQPRRAYHAAHIAERYGLFTIIVLGESVVVTVSGLDAGASTDVVAVALLGFGIAVTIWWTYFGRYRDAPGGTAVARFVWAQVHVLVFAGIAAAAVGVEFAVEAASEGRGLELVDRHTLGAGLAAYLLAMGAIRATTRHLDRIAGRKPLGLGSARRRTLRRWCTDPSGPPRRLCGAPSPG